MNMDRANTPSFRQNVGATFNFKECSYTIKVKKAQKELVRACSASVPAGQVLAILGPSGAGKTTLLSLLSLDKIGGSPTGAVTLNGYPFVRCPLADALAAACPAATPPLILQMCSPPNDRI